MKFHKYNCDNKSENMLSPLQGNTRLVVLAGPSGTGKGPLYAAAMAYYPELNDAVGAVSMIKSIESRPGGILRPLDKREDFLPASEIRSFSDNSQYFVGECRGLPQAVSMERLDRAAEGKRVVFLEAYYTIALSFLENRERLIAHGLTPTTIFLSPISLKNILHIKKTSVNFRNVITQIINKLVLGKQLARAVAIGQVGQALTPDFVMQGFSRAQDAIHELSSAYLFDHVIVCPHGEGDINWMENRESNLGFDCKPLGQAGMAVDSLAAVLHGVLGLAQFDDTWPSDLFDKII